MVRPRHVSIKDIARRAGVSHSTVSRALADSPLIADDTKERIRRLAREMEYSPSAIARGLVTQRTSTVGMVVTTIADPFIAEVVRGVEETALDHGYSVILCDCNAEPERELNCVQALREKRVDSIIVTSSRVGNLYVPLLEELAVPIVLINNQHDGHYVHSIRIDDVTGGYIAGSYLASLGHRDIAYIAGPAGTQSSRDRLEGLKRAMQECGREVSPAWIVPGDGRPEGGERSADQILRADTRPTAILCYNDMTAIGALRTLRSAGVRIPQDISVMGYDDIRFAAYVEPPLTTISQPKYTLGQRAFLLALNLVDHQDELADSILIPELVVRDSCGYCTEASEAS
ncbi:MAG: LacI family transcriptional regulator [Chloroflexi bacterium]|nr:LacI family transcriptional regulator [Chloroflexota bacterium]